MEIIVYTLECCPNCENVKEYLSNNGYEYATKDFQDNFAEVLLMGGTSTAAPVISVDGVVYDYDGFMGKFGC